MTAENRCPSCGHVNAAGREECERCSYPLNLTVPPVAAPAAAKPEPVREPEPAPAPAPSEREPEPEPAPQREPAARVQAFDPNIRRMRPVRSRPAQTAAQKLQFQLWLGVGGFCVLLLLYTAFQGWQKNNAPQAQVEGANQDMQHAADMARAELAKDSTNTNARIMLANVLYDTANWSEAVIHYRAALRRDSTRVTTLVDLGVCYFNLGQSDAATELFQRALAHEPNHPIALFNLGVVAESRNDLDGALRWYDRAKSANPPPALAQGIEESRQRALQKKQGGGGGMGGR